MQQHPTIADDNLDDRRSYLVYFSDLGACMNETCSASLVLILLKKTRQFRLGLSHSGRTRSWTWQQWSQIRSRTWHLLDLQTFQCAQF